tara:strand:+ start:68 stop:1282 length:1215 start_codon:yes stop_codon:yes gene_type:complete
MSLSTKQEQFVQACKSAGMSSPAKRSDLVKVANSLGMKYAPAWIVQNSECRTDERGWFTVPGLDKALVQWKAIDEPVAVEEPVAAAPVMNAIMGLTGGERESLVPTMMKDFVAWGHFKTIEQIISSGLFAPVFVTGMSGNGKTTMIEQVCAKAKRECFRVNITQETDEDDLIGGFRLVDGETVFSAGPIVEAMRNGAVLLLDEIDLGSSKIMCLQPVLEGKGVFIKKTGEWVSPAKGFTVVATANTKGKGDNDGRFIGTNVMNEAFLDRFDWTLEQEYATKATEKKILIKKMEKFGHVDSDFADYLVKWAEITRKAFTEGAVDEIITTRRLENICKAFSIFKDRKKSVDLALARFDTDTQSAFISLYEKVDETCTMDSDPIDPDRQYTSDPTPPVNPNAINYSA